MSRIGCFGNRHQATANDHDDQHHAGERAELQQARASGSSRTAESPGSPRHAPPDSGYAGPPHRDARCGRRRSGDTARTHRATTRAILDRSDVVGRRRGRELALGSFLVDSSWVTTASDLSEATDEVGLAELRFELTGDQVAGAHPTPCGSTCRTRAASLARRLPRGASSPARAPPSRHAVSTDGRRRRHGAGASRDRG